MAPRNPYEGRAENPLAKLERRAADDTRRMLAAVRRNIVRLRGVVAGAKDPQQLRVRDKLYREVYAAYAELGRTINGVLKGGAENAAMLSAKAVVDSLAGSGRDLFRFSLERARRYWRYICPENGRSLAATMTDKMSEDLVETLRRAAVEVERQAAVEGWTRDETRKAIEDRWAALSKDERNFKFVDRSGKAWENGRYCQMLARTTATRVYNDSYLDRLAEHGFNFVRVSQHGSEPDCDVCRAWGGKICAISDKGGKYPTVEEARAAGVFHPNCMCTWEYVDEDEDRDELERQALKAGEEVDWNDPEAVERARKGERKSPAEDLKTQSVKDAVEGASGLFDAIAETEIPKSIAVREKRQEKAREALYRRWSEKKAAEKELEKADRQYWLNQGGEKRGIFWKIRDKAIAAARAANKKYSVAYYLHDKIETRLNNERFPWATKLIAHNGEKPAINTGTVSRLLPRWPAAREGIERIVAKDVFPSQALNIRKIKGRAFASGADIKLPGDAQIPIFVHETMHFVERFNQHVHERCVEFLQYRTEGEELQSLRKLTGKDYDSDEKARPDKFFDPYCGKDYGGRSTEILSMGVQRLVENPVKFLREDREYAAFCLALIRGEI